MLKTSTKISIKFTVFTIMILFIFWIIVNLIFFLNWYWNIVFQLSQLPINPPITQNELNNSKIQSNIVFENKNNVQNQTWNINILKEKSPIQVIPLFTQEANDILSNKFFKDIYILWREHILAIKKEDKLFFMFVNEQVLAQYNLIKITLFMTIVFGFLSYLISFLFIKTSLKWLQKLVEYVKNIRIDNMSNNLEIKWPPEDEIKIVADTLNTTIQRLNNQTQALKDFISNVSHELKTPIMMMNSDIDLALKSNNYEKWLINSKTSIKRLNNLLNNLIFITQLEKNVILEKEKILPIQMINKLIEFFSQKYKDKNISIKFDYENDLEIEANEQGFEIIVKNLIENAYKYTNNWWNIKIFINKQKFEIQDSWIWISLDNINKIWERFWQEDKSRSDQSSYGLWLYIVKKLLDLQWFTINIDSKKNVWTKFVVLFNHN